ncbi:ABC transporter substrate-binding protein [Alteribacillus sp. HJP-4]|uniref:ABC transporter substrate-binding protein n=1 Tax=Alteribacillus sp. HJP-4 TaxID=2775394 RepID=UPI0035CD24B8
MRKQGINIKIFAFLLVCVFVLGGCSGDNSESGSSEASNDGQKEITFWHGTSDTTQEALEASAKAFEEKNPDIKIKLVYTESSEGADQKLLTSIAGNNPPDVAYFDRFKVSSWVVEDALTDLTEKAEEDGITEDKYYDYAWEESSYNDKLYAVPLTTDSRLLYYNKDHFEEAGLDPNDPPKSIDELEEAAEALTVKEGKRFEQVGFIPWYGQGWLYSWGWGFGGDFYDEETGEVTANDPKIVEALEWMTEFGQKYGVEDISGFESSSGTGASDPFITGQLSMKIDGNFTMAGINKYKPDLNYGVTPIPTPTGEDFTTWSGGMSLVIPRGANNEDEAWEFLKFMASEDGQEVYSEISSDFSVIESVNESLGYTEDETMKEFINILDDSNSRPVIPEGQLLWNELVNAVENSTRGDGTPEENLDKATNKVNKALEEYE